MNYSDFIASKSISHKPSGLVVDDSCINQKLFKWQRALTNIALQRGRSALFEDCGLGKTWQQLEWARIVSGETSGSILILAPLAVTAQTAREAKKLGIKINICKSHDDVQDGINITNYHRLESFDPSVFAGVVLDESSILKNFSGKIRNQIIDSFRETPFKLCCTATPSPNDYTELGNTAEFLGVMTRAEMLSMFFINDTGDTGTWRLKGHANASKFWEWISSWSIMIQRPSDIGFDDGEFSLPPIYINELVIPYLGPRSTLFVEPASTLSERRDARKSSLDERVKKTADMINSSDETWIAWCNLNDESAMLTEMINDAVEVKGADPVEHKESAMMDFADGKIKCLVSKPSIAGLGMNFQSCSNMAFVGLSDSFEQYYQAVRRCWRFGQKKPVNAWIVTGEREGNVVLNIKRKEDDMKRMFDGMIGHMKTLMMREIGKTDRNFTDYIPTVEMRLPEFLEVSV